MTSPPLIQTRIDQFVGTIALSHREKRNAIGKALVAEVLAALDDFRARCVRVAVLRAAGGMSVWSAGFDVDELVSDGDPLASSATLDRLLQGIIQFPAPVIAMVHGSVWGGATDVILSCDLAIGDSSCSFAMPAANLGLAYNLAGLQRFARRLPLHRVKELFFAAQPVKAEQALAWGILNQLASESELESTTYALANQIAAKAPLAVTAVKHQLQLLAAGEPLTAELLAAVDALRQRANMSADFAEGVQAFREKRRPEFRGE